MVRAAAQRLGKVKGKGGKGKAKSSYTAPRAGDGKADIQGIWQAWNTAEYGLEAHNAATGIHAGKSSWSTRPMG